MNFFSGHPKDSTPEFEAVEKQLAKEEKKTENQFSDNFLKPAVPRTSQSSLKDDSANNISALTWGNMVRIFSSDTFILTCFNLVEILYVYSHNYLSKNLVFFLDLRYLFII
jgi:hypothetical protein